MGVTLYHFPWSAPSRAALLVGKTLGIDVDVQIVDLTAKDQLKPQFLNERRLNITQNVYGATFKLQINPQHCVPTLVGGDFVLWKSRAIAAYLVNSYAKSDSLYPVDPKRRAIVDQWLQFDCGTLYPRIRAICFPILFLGEIEVPDELKTSLDEAIGFLDVFLEGNNFVAENFLTTADIALVASLSSIVAVGWDVSAYGKVSAWLAQCSLEIPHYSEINQKGADMFAKAVNSKMAPGQI